MVVLYSCHHYVYLPDDKLLDESPYCHKCKAYVKVESTHAEFHVKCANCRYHRYYGAAKLTAQRAADAHSRNRIGHTVQVWQGDKIIEIRSPKTQQNYLPNCYGNRLDKPPF